MEEFVQLIAGSGREKAVFKLLQKQTNILSIMGVLATETKEFELIGDGIYSMHLTGTGFNYRILFCFLPDSRPALLLPFFERSGKGKTDYSSHLLVAQKRKSELEANYYGK